MFLDYLGGLHVITSSEKMGAQRRSEIGATLYGDLNPLLLALRTEETGHKATNASGF